MMGRRASATTGRQIDRRTARRAWGWLTALVVLMMVVTAVGSATTADAASGRPQVWGGTGWASSDSCSNGYCTTTNGHGDYRAVAVSGRLFAPYALVKVQVTNWYNASDVGYVTADAWGNIWYVSDAPICAHRALAFQLKAYDFTRQMWSTTATHYAC